MYGSYIAWWGTGICAMSRLVDQRLHVSGREYQETIESFFAHWISPRIAPHCAFVVSHTLTANYLFV